jgi:hypothetical protein
MEQKHMILLAGELLDLHQDGKIDLNTWARAKEFVEWFLVMKLEEN